MLNFILKIFPKEKVGMYSNLSKIIKHESFYIVKTMITNVFKIFLGFLFIKSILKSSNMYINIFKITLHKNNPILFYFSICKMLDTKIM
jgi:hypothetical protein